MINGHWGKIYKDFMVDKVYTESCVLNFDFVFQGHCFYHGKVLGMESSSVVLSTCSGLR